MRPSTTALALTVLALSCGAPNQAAPGELVKSKLQRLTTAAPAGDVTDTVRGTTDFALDVFRQLPGDANTAFSPYSVTVALGMTSAGAAGTTLSAFEHVLHIGLPMDRFHHAMNTVDTALASRGVGASGKDGTPFRLRVNNQLFSQVGMTLQAPFLDTLAQEYGTGVRLLDFAKDPEAPRAAINDWVKTNTEGLIPELLAKGTVNADTRLALVNTLYFNAGWKTKFPHDGTHDQAFSLLGGATKTVKMMAGEGVGSATGTLDGVTVVELPYSGDEVTLVVLAPPEGKLHELEQGLSAQKLDAYVAAMTPSAVAVQMPRFEARTQASLKDVLSALGLGVAFSGEADFSGMTGTRELQLQAVVHEAVVKTDEDGTEAAAATAVLAGKVSAPQYVTINRPFVYVVRDRATGAVLFVGRIVEP